MSNSSSFPTFPVYYRVMSDLETGLPVVCTLQDFDEVDYDVERRWTDERFETEEEATVWVNRILAHIFRLTHRQAVR